MSCKFPDADLNKGLNNRLNLLDVVRCLQQQSIQLKQVTGQIDAKYCGCLKMQHEPAKRR